MAFDYALLPATLRPWIEDTCDRLQCPTDFAAVAAMTALGAVVGRKVGVGPQARTDWTVTPNFWGIVVGRPGVLKSPAMEAALAPLKRLSVRAVEVHDALMKEHRIAVKRAKIQGEEGEKSARAALKKNPNVDLAGYLSEEEPEAPALRRYIVNDCTAASLGELHRQNPNGFLVFRDELVSLLRSLDREDNAEARGFYLTSWNGDSPYTFDRIMRGMNLHIPAVCLSLLGSTQPGRLAEYVRHAVRGGAADDGLIQRFGLIVWPDGCGDWRNVDRWPDKEAEKSAFRVFEQLDTMDPVSIGAKQDTYPDGSPAGSPYLRFAPAALEVFTEWRTLLEHRLLAEDLHPALASHLAKYRKLVPGLALILHLADGGVGPVSERATIQALGWSEYAESHARRAYSSGTQANAVAAKAILKRTRKGDLASQFTARDVWRPGWTGLDREAVADGLALLVDYDWLIATERQTGGRPVTMYEVNPRGIDP
jgi:putative DNA primase/helicase